MNEPLTVLYVYPGKAFWPQAERFVRTYIEHAPEYPHRVVVMLNGCELDQATRDLFAPVTVYFIHHDNTGWDIGAYLAYAKTDPNGVVFCCGTYVYFHRAGWLRKLIEARERFGGGIYGVSGSYEKYPHLNTSAFMVETELLRAYPHKVRTKEERYAFEHGPKALHLMARSKGWAVRAVYWSGIFSTETWRQPKNIFRRGDQTNLLCWWNYTDDYRSASEPRKRELEKLTDGKPKIYETANFRIHSTIDPVLQRAQRWR